MPRATCMHREVGAVGALGVAHVHHFDEGVDVGGAHIALRVGGRVRGVVAARQLARIVADLLHLHQRRARARGPPRAEGDGLAAVRLGARIAAGGVLVGEVLGDDAQPRGLHRPCRGRRCRAPCFMSMAKPPAAAVRDRRPLAERRAEHAEVVFQRSLTSICAVSVSATLVSSTSSCTALPSGARSPAAPCGGGVVRRRCRPGASGWCAPASPRRRQRGVERQQVARLPARRVGIGDVLRQHGGAAVQPGHPPFGQVEQSDLAGSTCPVCSREAGPSPAARGRATASPADG